MEPVTLEQMERLIHQTAQKHWPFDEPIPDFNTRYPNILESCLSLPFSGHTGGEFYPSDLDKIAILFYVMNKNHPFSGGNKRVAMMTLLYCIVRRGLWLNADQTTFYRFAMDVAKSNPRDKEKMLRYIKTFIHAFTENQSPEE